MKKNGHPKHKMPKIIILACYKCNKNYFWYFQIGKDDLSLIEKNETILDQKINKTMCLCRKV